MITLRKPTHAIAYLGDPHVTAVVDGKAVHHPSANQVEVRGVIVGRNGQAVKIRVTSVRGIASGIDYSRHLKGAEIVVPANSAALF